MSVSIDQKADVDIRVFIKQFLKPVPKSSPETRVKHWLDIYNNPETLAETNILRLIQRHPEIAEKLMREADGAK